MVSLLLMLLCQAGGEEDMTSILALNALITPRPQRFYI